MDIWAAIDVPISTHFSELFVRKPRNARHAADIIS